MVMTVVLFVAEFAMEAENVTEKKGCGRLGLDLKSLL